MDLIDRRRFLAGTAALAAAPAFAADPPAAFPPPARELMVPVEGGRIYVRVDGDLAGPRPPVVMIHGGPGGTHGGALDALALTDERAMISYDQLDSGRSDHPENPRNWRVPRFVDELEAIRAALGVRRWHVHGASWGGTVALEYGARRPAALAGLALVSPLVSTKAWIADAKALIASLPPEVRGELERCGALTMPVPPKACDAPTDAFYAAFNARMRPSPAAIDYHRKRSGRGFNERLYRAMWGASEFVATGTLKDYDGEPLLARLDGARTLFMCGQYDEARPLTTAAYAARVPGAEFAVVPGAAHAVLNDRPVETVALLRAWLARQDALG